MVSRCKRQRRVQGSKTDREGSTHRVARGRFGPQLELSYSLKLINYFVVAAAARVCQLAARTQCTSNANPAAAAYRKPSAIARCKRTLIR